MQFERHKKRISYSFKLTLLSELTLIVPEVYTACQISVWEWTSVFPYHFEIRNAILWLTS